MMRGFLATLLSLPLLSSAAAAADEPQQVKVTAEIDADEIRHARLQKGVAAFDAYRQLAPDAQLRYQIFDLKPEHAQPLQLQLRSGGERTAVPLAPDGTFAFPLAGEPSGDAVLRTNRRDGTVAWRVSVRSPGLRPNQRRLGDLRLECEVNRAVDLLHGYKPPSYYAIAALTDVCKGFLGGWLVSEQRPVFGVRLVHGARSRHHFNGDLYLNRIPAPLRVFYDTELADRTYYVPIGDASWPDDTLVEITFMDDDPGEVRS
jgi:hypothetical protein